MSFIDHIQIPVSGRSIPVTIAGAGEPVLFVHGFPLSRWMWHELLQQLSHNFLCIAPDLRGFGDAPEETTPFSLSDLADDLTGLLDHLQVRAPVTLVGLSMGGYVAFEFVANHKNRLGRLVLMDTRASVDTPSAREGRLAMADRVIQSGSAAETDLMIPKVFAPSTLKTTPELVLQWQQRFARTAPSTIAFAQRAMANRYDFSDELSSILVPTLCLVGEFDSLTPVAEMTSLASHIPKARLKIISKSGHLPPLENPNETAKALRTFLEST